LAASAWRVNASTWPTALQYGYICTGEAFVFLRIPEDPTVVQYYLCVPNQESLGGERLKSKRKYLANSSPVEAVLIVGLYILIWHTSQKWHDTAHDKLSTWKVEYLDILREIPETVRTQGNIQLSKY
jgi:hypothetical protein